MARSGRRVWANCPWTERRPRSRRRSSMRLARSCLKFRSHPNVCWRRWKKCPRLNLKMKITFQVNSVEREVDSPPMKRLLDVLREDLRLTATKEGCGEGECGACSVIVDGEVINSCLTPICQMHGANLLTAE